MNLITSDTGITIGLVITVGSCIWWAASMQSKVDMLLKLFTTHAQSQKALESQIDKLEDRVLILEQDK